MSRIKFLPALLAFLLLAAGCAAQFPAGPSETAASYDVFSVASPESFPDFTEESSALPESEAEPESSSSAPPPPVSSARPASKAPAPPASSAFVSSRSGELRAVWISFLDMNFTGKTKAQFEDTAASMMENLKSLKINAAVIHVRANSDAYYKSTVAKFPFAKNLTGTQGKDPGYDPLEIFIREAHKRGIEVHAWFNPFRISSGSDTLATLADSNPAKKWRADGSTDNDSWVVDLQGDLKMTGANDPKGIYYNPAVPEVQRLILDGVREVLANYDVDGVHFDDYFYPTTSPAFDKKEYDAYCKTAAKPLSLGDWRRLQVNSLVTGIYAACKAEKRVFGISPAANIESNRNSLFADVAYWLKSGSFVDYICPQIYFGFEYPNTKFRFDVLCKQWGDLVKDSGTELYIGLAPYKIGQLDPESNPAADEWQKKNDILRRQVEHIRKLPHYGGFMLFSYKYVFPDPGAAAYDLKILQRNNLLALLNP